MRSFYAGVLFALGFTPVFLLLCVLSVRFYPDPVPVLRPSSSDVSSADVQTWLSNVVGVARHTMLDSSIAQRVKERETHCMSLSLQYSENPDPALLPRIRSICFY